MTAPAREAFVAGLTPMVEPSNRPILHAASAPVKRFRLLSDLELDEIPEPDPLIEGIAYANSLILLVGVYASMKTFLFIDWAGSIGVGMDWHGRRVTQGDVVYIYAEGAWGIKRRLAAWKKAIQYTGSANVYFLPTSVMMSDEAQVGSLIVAIRERGLSPRAVFIDTVARNSQGDESTAKDMGAFIRGCDTIREAFGAAVFLAHHTGWSADRSRGSSSLPGATDTEMIVERDDMRLTLRCTKQKEGPEFAPITIEAFPIAGSLALKPVVPNSPVLTANERRALAEVQDDDGLSSTEWEEASSLAHGSYTNARKRLLQLSYVRLRKKRYCITDAGKLALSTKYNAATIEVQSTGSHEVLQTLGSLEPSLVPEHAIDAAKQEGGRVSSLADEPLPWEDDEP